MLFLYTGPKLDRHVSASFLSLEACSCELGEQNLKLTLFLHLKTDL